MSAEIETSKKTPQKREQNQKALMPFSVREIENINSQTKVPFLGDIPYLGKLFRRERKTDNKRELLIFVTPRIVNDTLTRNH